MRLRLGASLASEELLLLRECCLRTDRLLLPELHLRGGSGLDLAPSSRSDGPVRDPLDMRRLLLARRIFSEGRQAQQARLPDFFFWKGNAARAGGHRPDFNVAL